MAEGEKIGGAFVDIDADMTNFDNAMAALPRKAASKMDDAMKALAAQMAKTKLETKVALNAGDIAGWAKLLDVQQRLQAKIDAVTAAATRQAQALQDAARAAHNADSLVPRGPRDPRAQAIPDYSKLTKGGKIDLAELAKFEQLGRAGRKAGDEIAQGGRSGAMGWLMFSQAVEDAQFGFQSVLNNIPGIVMALGGSAGLAGAVSLASVAINTWVKHWDDAKAAFGGDWSSGLAKKFKEVENAILSAGAALVNFNSGISLTGADVAFNQRGLAARAEQKKAQEKATEDAASTVGGVKGRADEERGQAFTEALRAYGGGEKLGAELAAPLEAAAVANVQKRAKTARDKSSPQYDPGFDLDLETQKARKKARDAANLQIAAAMRGDEGTIENVAKASPGLAKAQEQTAQQAIEVQGRENTRAFMKQERERAKKRKEDAAEFDMEASEVRARENERLAGSMAGSKVGRGLLAPGGMSEEALQAGVRSSLSASGMASNQVDAAAAGVAKKLREKMDRDVGARARDRGIGVDEARGQLLREANKQAMEERIRDAGGKTTGEFTHGAEAIYQKMQLGATAEDVRKNAGLQVAENQLEEAKTTNKKLTESQELFQRIFKDAKPGAATFGPAKR